MLVANADNNTVAVVDVAKPGASRVQGWIPVGWYPTGVLFIADGARRVRAGRQGAHQRWQPARSAAGRRADRGAVHGRMLQGALSIIADARRGRARGA